MVSSDFPIYTVVIPLNKVDTQHEVLCPSFEATTTRDSLITSFFLGQSTAVAVRVPRRRVFEKHRRLLSGLNRIIALDSQTRGFRAFFLGNAHSSGLSQRI